MNESGRDLSTISVRAYTAVADGPLSEREVSQVFWDELKSRTESDYAYLGDVAESLHVPYNLFEKPVGPRLRNALDANSLVLAIQFFLATPVGAWAVSKVCDDIYDGAIVPALRKLTLRRREQGFAETPFMFLSGVWYDESGVYIGTAAEVSGLEDSALDDLLKAAQRQGLDWVAEHGVTKPVLLYEIRNGRLSDEPKLLDSVPTRP